MKHEMSRQGILDELWREKFGYWRCIPLAAPPTPLHARRGWVGGAGASLGLGTEYIAEVLTPFIQMDGKVAALYLHAK